MKIFGQHDDRTINQLKACIDAEKGSKGVLCADGHLGYSMPIGGVVAYREHLSPSGVGFDIACGNLAVQTDAKVADVNIKTVMDDVWANIAFGVGRKNPAPVDHPVLDEIGRSECGFQRGLQQMAASQLGTVGSGNHYVDLFEDENGLLWIGVHFGSRGFGHKTATWALEQAGATDQGMDAPPVLIPTASELGLDYLVGMQLAGEYAYAGRETVVDAVRKIIGCGILQRVHNHHNFAWAEEHGGETFWVHRKGATPAFPGQQGFVGSTMQEPSVILEGVDSDEAKDSFYSTVHGAGRVLSRTKAAGKKKHGRRWQCGNYRNCSYTAPVEVFTRKENEPNPTCPDCSGTLRRIRFQTVVRPGLINYDEVQKEVSKTVELRGGGADEAPACYKRLPDVLKEHGDTVKVLHTLRPVGVAMAGIDEHDPYKD